MKITVVSFMVIGLLALSSAAPKQQTDPVDRFLGPLFNNIKDVLNTMEMGQNIPQSGSTNQDTKFANSEYTIAEPVPDKDGKTSSTSSFLATTLQSLLKNYIASNPQLAILEGDAVDPNVIKYVTGMFSGAKVSDLMKLALETPLLHQLYSDFAGALPLFSHLKNVIERVSPQDRVLGEVLMGNNPQLRDLQSVAEDSYSLDKLLEAIKQDREFEDFLEMTLDKEPTNPEDALQLLTGDNGQQDGGVAPNYQDKYSVTSTDIAGATKRFNLATTALFCFENFSDLLAITNELSKPSPQLDVIISLIFNLKLSSFNLQQKF